MGKHSIALGFLIVAFAAAQAPAAPFSPEPLKISAPSQINIEHGRPLTFPFTLSGGPATVGLAIFTQGWAQTVRNIRNGYLGWHYLNCVDTCMYISPPRVFPPGANTITWDGLDKGGFQAVVYEHRYYLLAYDTESAPEKAFETFRGYGFGRSTLVAQDEQGKPLANPAFYSNAKSSGSYGETWNTRARWVLGGDPDDPALLETTRYRSHPDRGRMAISLRDYRLFIAQAIESGKMDTREWEWVPNGDAVLQEYWGEDAIDVDSTLDPNTAVYSGPVAVHEGYLLSTDLARWDSRSFPALDFFDANDGTLIKRIDLSPWFGENTAPAELAQRNDCLLLSSPGSALFLTVNPFVDEESLFAQWENGIGDGFADTLPDPGTTRGAAMDRYGFVQFAENGSGPSIGVFAPDGTGAGLFPLPGMTGSCLDGLQVIDTGSAFDGIYFGTADNGGEVRQMRFAMCEGMVRDPAEWFFSHVFIVLPWQGNTLPAGEIFTVTWHGVDYRKLCIEFSDDGGSTWTTVASDIPETAFWGQYRWTVPNIRSSTCLLRLTSTVNPLLTSTSGVFTIDGPTAVADESSPRPLVTISNSPNPFNPSTTIAFTLDRPGAVTLSVYDITGRKVAELARGFHSAGKHEVVWNAEGCASGVYFGVLKAGSAVETRKMLLMR